MSRWIDADALIADLDKGLWGKDWDKALAEAIIREAPSIDIVSCKECKYWKSTVQMPNGTEVKCLYGRKADDFCSYGSRSEKPNNLSENPTDSERVGKYPYNCNWDE